MYKIQVNLDQRSYPIYISEESLSNLEIFEKSVYGKKVVIITNKVVAPLYLQGLISLLDGYSIQSVVLDDGESSKSLETLEKILNSLIEEHQDRSTTLIALGGGVVGDITGFVAAIYKRGISHIQVPTTLLSQVDSSVGGKTGINHAACKNVMGVFCQPKSVIIDTSLLRSLPYREFVSGMAEVIKYALILDSDFFVFLEKNIDKIKYRDTSFLNTIVKRCCEIKAAVISVDEHDLGPRLALNFGHTFGHAIESYMAYNNIWLHGEAVSVGIVISLEMSVQMGWIPREDSNRVARLFTQIGLPTSPPTKMKFIDFMRHILNDKKISDGQIRLVLLQKIGKAVVTDKYPLHTLKEVLDTKY